MQKNNLRADSPRALFYGKDEIAFAWDEVWPQLAEVNIYQSILPDEYPVARIPDILQSSLIKEREGENGERGLILRHDLGKKTREQMKKIFSCDCNSITYTIIRTHPHDEYEFYKAHLEDANGNKIHLSGKIIY